MKSQRTKPRTYRTIPGQSFYDVPNRPGVVVSTLADTREIRINIDGVTRCTLPHILDTIPIDDAVQNIIRAGVYFPQWEKWYSEPRIFWDIAHYNEYPSMVSAPLGWEQLEMRGVI
jgi:hypothetical protein